MKKLLALVLAMSMVVAVSACGGSSSTSTESTSTPESSTVDSVTVPATDFSAGMVTDVGGVNDQSFNQSAWEGLQSAESKYGIKIGYVESKQDTDYGPNLDRMVDEEYDLIWGVGFALADGILKAAQTNPDMTYAIVDSAYAETPANMTGILFRAEEPSFLVGYIAGMMSESNKVGFIGGVEGDIIGTFQYGYEAGVAMAAKEKGKEIEVMVQYAASFGDPAIGKTIATKMYSDGADIIFHAAGGVGIGLFEAAKEANKYAIGVDMDQSHLAPENVITSALKLVGSAMADVSKRVMDGEELGGQTLNFGCKEGYTDYVKSDMIPAEIQTKTDAVKAGIIDGSIVVPSNAEMLESFKKAL